MNPFEAEADQATAFLLHCAREKDKEEQELRDIQAYGIDRILEQQTPCALQTEIRPEAIEVMDWVRRFMQRNPYDVLAGVAANQLSLRGERIMIRACVVRGQGGVPIVAFNPRIVDARAPSFQAKEGCLTWPGKWIHAMRHTGVRVEFESPLGLTTTHEAEGFEAQVWQHEINHLDGVTEDVRSKEVVKQRPNDLCACGRAGLKFKKCCGR
jgi:peptide deformylase